MVLGNIKSLFFVWKASRTMLWDVVEIISWDFQCDGFSNAVSWTHCCPVIRHMLALPVVFKGYISWCSILIWYQRSDTLSDLENSDFINIVPKLKLVLSCTKIYIDILSSYIFNKIYVCTKFIMEYLKYMQELVIIN